MARHVRTAKGVEFFHKPVGSLITPGEYESVRAKLLAERKIKRTQHPVGHPERLKAEQHVRHFRKEFTDDVSKDKIPGAAEKPVSEGKIPGVAEKSVSPSGVSAISELDDVRKLMTFEDSHGKIRKATDADRIGKLNKLGKLTRLLRQNGVSIHVPSGQYTYTRTGDQVPGVYNPNTRELKIARQQLQGTTSLHEASHALDHAFGRPSRTPEWQELSAHIYHNTRTTKKWASPGETFAELFGQYINDPTKRMDLINRIPLGDEKKVKQYFARLLERLLERSGMIELASAAQPSPQQQQQPPPKPPPPAGVVSAVSGALTATLFPLAALKPITKLLPLFNLASGISQSNKQRALQLALSELERYTPPVQTGFGYAQREVIALNQQRRSGYVVSATKRIAQALADAEKRGVAPAAALAEQRASEDRYFNQHVQATTQRVIAGSNIDAMANQYGGLLGWYARHDAKVTPECAAADGKNFRVDAPPDIGYPGIVHLACRCRAGAPHENAEELPGGSIDTIAAANAYDKRRIIELVRHVRTASGEDWFNEPIGSLIVTHTANELTSIKQQEIAKHGFGDKRVRKIVSAVQRAHQREAKLAREKKNALRSAPGSRTGTDIPARFRKFLSRNAVIPALSDADRIRAAAAVSRQNRLQPSDAKIDAVVPVYGLESGDGKFVREKGNELLINPYYFTPSSDKDFRDKQKSGWSVPVDPQYSMLDYTIAHEAGHLAAGKLSSAQINEVEKKLAEFGVPNQVSEYAKRNFSETLAELWAEASLSSHPRPAAKWYASYIRKRAQTFTNSRKGTFELARHVRTEAGVSRFHRPVGSLITNKNSEFVPLHHVSLDHSSLRKPLQGNYHFKHYASFAFHKITAHDELGEPVAELKWHRKGLTNPVTNRPYKPGEILWVNVDGEHKRKGIASAMLDAALNGNYDTKPRHSKHLMTEGAQWADVTSLSRPLELVRHVRTPSGVARFNEPIGAPITEHEYVEAKVREEAAKAHRNAVRRASTRGPVRPLRGTKSQLAVRSDDKRIAQGQTRSNFEHPFTGAPMSKSEIGDTYEELFRRSGAELLAKKYPGAYVPISHAEGGARNTPLDFRLNHTFAGELKTLSSRSANQKTAIKREEIERKVTSAKKAKLKPLLVVQVVDQSTGTVEVYAYPNFVSKAVRAMEYVGSYTYSKNDFKKAQQAQGNWRGGGE